MDPWTVEASSVYILLQAECGIIYLWGVGLGGGLLFSCILNQVRAFSANNIISRAKYKCLVIVKHWH